MTTEVCEMMQVSGVCAAAAGSKHPVAVIIQGMKNEYDNNGPWYWDFDMEGNRRMTFQEFLKMHKEFNLAQYYLK